jgi:hypothetical protein
LAFFAAIPVEVSAVRAAARSRSTRNLKLIGLAIHNFEVANGRFPADIRDEDGTPLLSWRVRLLPFLEEVALFNEFHLDEPWDSPHNRPLLERMPAAFRDPDAEAEPGRTFYRGVAGPGTVLDPTVPSGIRIADVTDGTSNTLAVVQAREAVAWSQPGTDLPFESPAELPAQVETAQALQGQLGGPGAGGFHALFLDGSTRFLRDTISPLVLRALVTRNGGEVVSSDDFE